MSRCRKNVKKGTKPPTFFQKIAKYRKKPSKNRKIFQKMSKNAHFYFTHLT